jgi:GT2 family glycosyltransferase
MTKVLVTLVNFNGNKDTLSCLDSLDKVKIQEFDLSVVVVDNASREIFKADRKYQNFDLKIIRSDTNLGFAGGQNLGIKWGLENGIDYFCVLNNDVLLDENFLVELLGTFEIEKNCGIVSPKIYFAKGHEFHKDRYKEEDLGKVIWYAGGYVDWQNIIASHKGVDEVDRGQFDKLEKTDFASGCSEMIKKEVFEKIGLFDEKYFLYYEDNDLSQRAKKSGFEIYYQPKSILWHINAGSTGGSGSELQDYYITRNRLLFGFKYASFKTQFALVRESLRLILSGRPSQKKGAKDFYLKKFGKGSYSE